MSKQSIFWNPDLTIIFKNKYNYQERKLFFEEAEKIINQLDKIYQKYQLKFTLNSKSLKKAIWILNYDAVITTKICLDLLKKRKHLPVGKMFRDVVESLDISELIENKRGKYLKKFYNDEIINHRSYRKHVIDSKDKKHYTSFYRELSKWTHHTYTSLKFSYNLGKNDKMWRDNIDDILASEGTIVLYIWFLALLIRKIINNSYKSIIFNKQEKKLIIKL